MREFGSKKSRTSPREGTRTQSRLRKATRQRRCPPRPSVRAEAAMETIFEDEFSLGDVDMEALVVAGVLVVGVVLLFVLVE